jgi:membrane-associated protein
LFPPVVVNLLAGMSNMPWRVFLFYNATGSAAYSASYILIGYFFGKQWKQIEAWLGFKTLYLMLAGLAIVALSVIFRHFLSRLWARFVSKSRG